MLYKFLSEHHFLIIYVTTLENPSYVRDKLDTQRTNDVDLHLPAHAHNADYLLHLTRNVNVISVYYNPGVFLHDEYLSKSCNVSWAKYD